MGETVGYARVAAALDGKVVIVTGAAGGIGRAAARLFSEAGARLLLADLAGEGEEVAAQISANGGKARFVITDIGSEVSVAAMVDAALELYGRLDGAFNNAGIVSQVMPTADVPLADFEKVIRTNLVGTFLCMKHEIVAMLKTGGGAIVNTASGLAQVAQAGASAYCASKAGVLGITRVAAVEYAAKGIRINAVLPGMVNTGMIAAATPEILAAARSLHPLGRLAEPEEIAAVASFLLSGAASFVTGTGMAVDGGYLAL